MPSSRAGTDLPCPPTSESVLGKDLVSEVPFAHEGRIVIPGQHLGDGRYVGGERHVAGRHARRVGPQAGEHGRPGRTAHGLAHVGVLEDEAVLGKPVERRGFDLAVSVAGQCIGALLVRENVEQVGSRHVWPSRLAFERGVRLNQVSCPAKNRSSSSTM